MAYEEEALNLENEMAMQKIDDDRRQREAQRDAKQKEMEAERIAEVEEIQSQIKQLELTKRANMLRTRSEIAASNATVQALDKKDRLEDCNGGGIVGYQSNTGMIRGGKGGITDNNYHEIYDSRSQ